jgi:hypothetical protein
MTDLLLAQTNQSIDRSTKTLSHLRALSLRTDSEIDTSISSFQLSVVSVDGGNWQAKGKQEMNIQPIDS